MNARGAAMPVAKRADGDERNDQDEVIIVKRKV